MDDPGLIRASLDVSGDGEAEEEIIRADNLRA
jgi:hypothetical protein